MRQELLDKKNNLSDWAWLLAFLAGTSTCTSGMLMLCSLSSGSLSPEVATAATYGLSAASLACGIGMFKRYKNIHKETFDMVEQQIEDEKEPDHSVEVIINSMAR